MERDLQSRLGFPHNPVGVGRGLSLVADASGFEDQFKIFALVLFPIVLFLGVATYVRLVQINLEDIYLVGAMNRLRRAYIDAAPEMREYLTSGVSDVKRVYGLPIFSGDPNLVQWHSSSRLRQLSLRPWTQ